VGIEVSPVIETGDGLSSQGTGSDVPVEKRQVAPESDLGSQGDGSVDIKAVIVFRTHIYGFVDGYVLINGIADGIAGIINNIGLYVLVGAMIEEDDIQRAALSTDLL